jgi:hypothetical protein
MLRITASTELIGCVNERLQNMTWANPHFPYSFRLRGQVHLTQVNCHLPNPLFLRMGSLLAAGKVRRLRQTEWMQKKMSVCLTVTVTCRQLSDELCMDRRGPSQLRLSTAHCHGRIQVRRQSCGVCRLHELFCRCCRYFLFIILPAIPCVHTS